MIVNHNGVGSSPTGVCPGRRNNKVPDTINAVFGRSKYKAGKLAIKYPGVTQ